MLNETPSLVTLADRILIPAVSLTELPDLNIQPSKVQEMILDYISEQDCPGALAHLQRELVRATRRPHCAHSTSRLVQLVAKGLLYEKNTPRLDSILQGCNSIMRSLENESQDHQANVVSSGIEDQQQSTSHPTLKPHTQARQSSVPRPQLRNPDSSHTQLALHHHANLSTEPKRGRTGQCSSKLEQPSFPQAGVSNVLLPAFSAPTCGPEAGSSSLSASRLLAGQNYHDHLIQSNVNRDFSSYLRASASLGDAPHSFKHIASPTLGSTPCLLNSNINSIITAQPLDKDSHPSTLPSKSQLNPDGSPFMAHENKANQAQANSHVRLPSTDPLDPSPLPSGLRGRWHTVGDTDEIMCLDTDGCPAPELISAPVSNAHHSRRNELPDAKPNLSQKYGHESAVLDTTLPHMSPRRSSTKRSRGIPSAQPSPPIKRSRPDLASPSGKGPSNSTSPNRSLLTSPTNVMLYDFSDADLPGTPPEVSPHISWQAIPDLSQGNIGTQNRDDAHTENMFMEPEPPRDLSDVGTPRGSPSYAAELDIPTKAPVASPSKVLTPPVMITEDNIDSTHHGTLAELHSSTLLGPQTHTFTTVCDSGPDATNQETTSTCQVLQPNVASESSTPSAIMIELRAKLFASRKPRPPVAPVVPVAPVAPVVPAVPVVPAIPVAPAASVAPVPPQVLCLQVPSAEPPPLPSLSLEQNLKAHLKSRQGASPPSQSQAGATEELEDGQISTPPPEENPSRPKLPPPTIKHPLPPKPDFLPSSSNYQHKANLNPSTCFLPPVPVPSPMDGTLSHSNGISIFNLATPQPMRSSNPTIVQNPQLGPPPSIIAQPTKVTHIAHLPAKVSQNGQEWQDLKERTAKLKVHLARLRADPTTRQVQRSTSSQGSLGQNGTSAPTSSSSHPIPQNQPKSPVFDGAKRHDRPSALDTFNLCQTDLKSPSSASSANFTQPPECVVNAPAPRHVDDFFTSLQEQLDSNVKQPQPIHSTSVLKSVSEDSPRPSLSLKVHQVSQSQESESGLDTLRQSSTVEARTFSPSESAVSTAESSVEIFLADNPEEIVSIDATAPDSGSYLRDERLAQLADHPSTIPSLSKGPLDHSVCKAGPQCKDLTCIVGHCSSAAQHGAPTTCYRASDVRDASCPKTHSRVPTPAPMSTTNQSNNFWNNQLCRYDMQCLRQDCHFRHTWQKQHSTSSMVSASLPKRGSEGESTFHASNISASIPIIAPHSTRDGDTIRTISNQSLRHVPSPAPDKSQELIASSSSTTLSYSLRETRPAALQITLNGNLTTQPFPTTGSPVIENRLASHSHSSTSSGPWSVADQLEQYANPARGLRDWARQSDDSVLHLSPRISSPMLLPDHNIPLSSSMNNFSPIHPSYSPQCFELARPVPLSPRPSHSAFLSFDDADATSLPTVPLPSGTSGLSSHSSSSNFPQPLPPESPIQPIISVTHNDTHKRSDPHPTRSLPTGPSSRPIPSVANPVREERRTKSGKPRNPNNPNNLLVPPILNDLLLGVKKVGQQQIQSDLDLMNRRDPGGDKSEQIGTAVLSSLGWTSSPDRSKCKAVNPAAFRTFLQQSNLPVPIGLENEEDIRRMWTEVFEHPLTKNVYRYCQELKFGGLKRGRDEEEGKNPKIDNLKNALVIPIKIIGFIANGGRRWPKRKSR